MRCSISEMAKLSGVSIRTLHYYDEIDLLKPSEVISDTGYRYYNEEAMEQLQQILFYRELDFSLKDIEKIMHASDYSKEDALLKQMELLKLKRKRLNNIINLLSEKMEGETRMSFKEFNMKEIDEAKAKYAKEAEDRWGNTDAYKQSQKKTAGYTEDDWKEVKEKMDDLLQKFSNQIGNPPESAEVQKLVEEWKHYIIESYYDCTKEILAGLGQMYIADERFTKNMDKYGDGTAKLISEAIEIYCRE